jgi:methylthioribose-1-phosphate isomerase
MDLFSPIRFDGNNLELIDQLALPAEEKWVRCSTASDAARAIREMIVRGAPAIGVTAAYGVAMAARELGAMSPADFLEFFSPVSKELAETRPTAVNLFWALDEMRKAGLEACDAAQEIGSALRNRAEEIHRDDIEMCKRMGAFGAELLPDRVTILTHCNAGALATGGYGTALGVIRAAVEAGKEVKVFADETRPYLQGARLTAWELARDGIDVTLIPDSAAAFLIARGEIDCCVTGADRIAANGDVANKIGTYGVALAASAAEIPFYVAAPVSTLDLNTASGDGIPIEERSEDEVLFLAGKRVGPAGVPARNPAFDVTPAAMVSAIITDRGVARAPFLDSLAAFLK